MYKCPKCGNELEQRCYLPTNNGRPYLVCTKAECGFFLPIQDWKGDQMPENKPPDNPEKKSPEYRFLDCPSCNREMPSGVNYCPYCGAMVITKMRDPEEIKKMVNECVSTAKALPAVLSFHLYPHVMMIVRFADWILGGKESPLDVINKMSDDFEKNKNENDR
jgi:predicted RNA-binding Zn-ribbon protein involved in translation (DUF1610 family)